MASWLKFSALCFCLLSLAACKSLKGDDSATKGDEPAQGLSASQLGDEPVPTLPKVNNASEAWSKVNELVAVSRAYTGNTMCHDVRNEKLNGKRTTAECSDFCDTFQPDSLIDKALLLSSYSSFASYVTFFPQSMRKALNDSILYILGAKGSTLPALGWLSCGTIVVSAVTLEIFDTKRCESASLCLPCGSDRYARQACRAYDTVRTCAQSLGLAIPYDWTGLAARATCTGGLMAQKEIYRNTCKGACESSRAAAAPIAQVSEGAITCCRCDRTTYVDRWVADEPVTSDYYWNYVSDYKGPVAECEGKTNTSTKILLKSYDGYPEYYYYTKCSKVRLPGNKCPQDNGFHKTL